jgi:Mce-associated membrane protein
MESVMSTEDPVTEAPRARRRRNPLVVAGVALVTVAVVAAATFGALWAVAAHDSSRAFSQLRDDALRAARQGSINLTTLDYRHVQQGLNRWKDSTTGSLYSQLTSGSTTFAKQAVQAKAISTGTVKDGVITDLDEHAGKASALVYMNVLVSAAGSKPTTKLLPLLWQLTLTGSGWKLSALDQPTSTGQ